MCMSKEASHRISFKVSRKSFQIETVVSSLYLKNKNVGFALKTLNLREMASKSKMWKISGFLFALILVLCPSSAHCVPGSDWRVSGSNSREDVGANSYTTAYLNVTYIDLETKKLKQEKSEIGKFGDGKVGTAFGVLVHVSSWEGSHTGCAAPLRSSFGDGSLPKEPWIALVKRGQCNFEVKVENAFRHNASAVLVYNDRESPTLDKMKLTGTRNMSAVFTYKWKGEQLAKLIDNGSRVMLHISVATHCTRPHPQINRTSVLFVSISFVVLMLTSLAWLVFYYVQRFRYLHAKDRLSKRLCNAAKKALSTIPTKEIQLEDREVQGEGECCAVCIEAYKVTDDLRILPCKHEFHKSCIDPWLLEHRTCPMCKMNILKHFDFVSNCQDSVLQVHSERGRIDQNDFLRVRNNEEAEIRTQVEVPSNCKSKFRISSSCPKEGGEPDSSNQLLQGSEHHESCSRWNTKTEKVRKVITSKTNSTNVQEDNTSNQDTAQLLRVSSSSKINTPTQKMKFTSEDSNSLEKNKASHIKAYELLDSDICDIVKDTEINSSRLVSNNYNETERNADDTNVAEAKVNN